MIRTSKLFTLLTIVSSAAVLLSACEKDKVFLTGKRETILSIDTALESDPTIAHTAVHLPSTTRNKDWAQAGGTPSHAMPNLSLDKTLHRTWATEHW